MQNEVKTRAIGTSFSEYLTIENCSAVAERFNALLRTRPFTLVVSRKCGLVPCVLSSQVGPRPGDGEAVCEVTAISDKGKKAVMSVQYQGMPSERRFLAKAHACEKLFFFTDIHDGEEPSHRSTVPFVMFMNGAVMIQGKERSNTGFDEVCYVFQTENHPY